MSIFMAWNSVFSTDTQYAAGYLHDTQSRGSGALSSVACALLLAFRFESLVKLNDALRDMPNQGQAQKDLLRYSLMDKPRNVPESEPFVILWMSYEAAPLGIQAFQT
jgi:hypothetical protein